MPGIVGCITKLPVQRAEAIVRRMVAAMMHEQFYVSGAYAEKSHGVYLGWVSRNDSSFDTLPVRDRTGDVALVFSGEDYPELSAIELLKTKGYGAKTEDGSYLVDMYDGDPDFPRGLNGIFQGILFDRKTGATILFNDRWGMQRVYLYESKDAFYFAGEAKAILAVCPELSEIDPRGLAEFVSFGAVVENRTIFKGIQVLPNASAWSFRNGAVCEKKTYFSPTDWESQGPLALEPYYDQLHSTFVQALPKYFAGDRSIGMSLTGGLDTRMVLAGCMPERGTLPCYTFGSMYRENQDVRVARKVSEICEQQFEVLTAGQEFLAEFPKYAERAIYLTDGCVDVGRAPDLYLNEIARGIAPVRMTGLYGGEILRKVRAFRPAQPAEGLFSPEFLGRIQEAESTYAEYSRCHPLTFAAFRQGSSFLHGSLALERTQLTMRTPFLDNRFVETAYRSPNGALENDEVSLRLIADCCPRLAKIPTDRGVGGSRGALRSKAAHSWQQFLFKAEYAYDMGMPQWLAGIDHKAASLHLERIFLGRHKPFHFRIWYREALASYVKEILLDDRTLSRPFFDSRVLKLIVGRHLKGDRNYTNAIHKALTLELIHRLFVDVPPRENSMREATQQLSICTAGTPVV